MAQDFGSKPIPASVSEKPVSSSLRLLLWHTMIQVGAGWWFLDQGGYVPGFGLNETAPHLTRNQSQNRTNGTSWVATELGGSGRATSLGGLRPPNAGPSFTEHDSIPSFPYEGWFVGVSASSLGWEAPECFQR